MDRQDIQSQPGSVYCPLTESVAFVWAQPNYPGTVSQDILSIGKAIWKNVIHMIGVKDITSITLFYFAES